VTSPVDNDFNQDVPPFPSDHCDDYFIELCALSTTDALTIEEWRQLELHLSICASCREIKAQYNSVIATVLPALATEHVQAVDESNADSWSIAEAEASLMSRIDRENISTQTESFSSSQTFKWRGVAWPYAAAAAFLLISACAGYRMGVHNGRRSFKVVASPSPSASKAMEAEPIPVREKNEELEAKRAEELHRQLRASLQQLGGLKEQQIRLEHELVERSADLETYSRDRMDLEQQLETARSNAQSLQDKLDLATKQRSEDNEHSATLQAQVDELNASLREREQEIAENEELLQHDRDIRNLIGARDLYISEVYDVAKDGKTQKPFGRVFYTKGKSLVFYAYDLDQQPGVKTASTFQAWGRQGTDPQHDINLGIFYRDEKNQKRWIVKSTDPLTLAQIDAVFVTVEPNRETSKPSGKPLLFTYLRMTPNHP
jgi:predicted  nucleic acid-binding Zn-ribbon protein